MGRSVIITGGFQDWKPVWGILKQRRPTSNSAECKKVASEQCLHCLLTRFSIQNTLKTKTSSRNP